jgi:hypothetical protein
MAPPDTTGFEAWFKQVLGLAGPRVSTFMPPIPSPRLDDAIPGNALPTADQQEDDVTA